MEMLMATVLATLVLAIAASATLALAKGSQSLINYSEMNTESRFALENLGRNIRSANSVVTVNASEVRFTRITGDGSVEEIQYVYDQDAETLTYRNVTTDESKVLLHDINTLTLNFYTLRHNTTTNPIEVKHIQLEAELRREVLNLVNRNYIISARFMLRNHRVSD